jgi:hypothetical protein
MEAFSWNTAREPFDKDSTMQHTEALKRLRDFFRRDETVSIDGFSGPTLVDQEPDLVRETARHTMNASAWAASGHSAD